MKLTHKTVLATVGATCALGLAAPMAHAASYTGPNGFITGTCPGTVVGSGTVGGHPTARWTLWYSTANGGQNCLKVADRTAGSHYMEAMIRPAWDYHDGAKDTGTFTTYAGGVGVKRVAGRCIGITAVIKDNGRTYTRNIDSFHCG